MLTALPVQKLVKRKYSIEDSGVARPEPSPSEEEKQQALLASGDHAHPGDAVHFKRSVIRRR